MPGYNTLKELLLEELNQLYTAYLCLSEHTEDYAEMDFWQFMQSTKCDEDYLIY